MQLTEVYLILSIGLMVLISLFDNTQQEILDQKKSLTRVYFEGILFLWLPIVFLLIHLLNSNLTWEAIGVRWTDDWQSLLSLGLVVLVILYFIYSSYSLLTDEKAQNSLVDQMSSLTWFTPKTKKQFWVFTLGLSISAGICEELIFRGYLLHILTEYVGLSFAVIISSVLFGLCHLYQGWKHVLRTFVIGMVFCGVYLFSETLIIPILLHIALDVYGGITSYIVRNKI